MSIRTFLNLSLLLVLISCRSAPQEFRGDQCQTVLSIDSYGDIDTDKSFCRCRDYTISKEFIGSKGKVVRKKLSQCHEVMGFAPNTNTKLVNFYEHVRSEINEQEIEIGEVGEFQEGVPREVKESAGASEN